MPRYFALLRGINVGGEAYWLIRGKLSESPLFGMDLTKVTGGAPTTMRNMTTVRRLVAKYPTQD